MATLRRGITIILLLGLGAQAPPDYLGVPEWWGNITLVVRSKGSTTSTKGKETTHTAWNEEERVVYDVHLDARSPGRIAVRKIPDLEGSGEENRWQSWTNDLAKNNQLVDWVAGEGTSKTTNESKGEADAVTIIETSGTKVRAGTRSNPGQRMGLHVDVKKRVYAFTLPAIGALHERTIPCREEWTSTAREPNGIIDESGGLKVTPYLVKGDLDSLPEVEIDSNDVKVFDQKLPAGVDILKGSVTVRIKGPVKIDSQAVVTWQFSPKAPPPVELELEAKGSGAASWDKWRPIGGPDERTPGSNVTLTATVVSRGAPLTDKPRRISLFLAQVSREKGVCINFPAETAAITDADLQFRESDNPGLLTAKSWVRIVDPPKPQLKANLSCLDYGAWGEVLAEAELESGRVILGHLKGKPAEHVLRIPDRPENSKIASMWMSPGADDADDDDKPTGDGFKGDGLTNYEEYRGFYEQGHWKEGDPAKKDCFIRNEAGGLTEDGVKMFEELSELCVHRLADKELSKDKAINFNRTDGPHRVVQHGILIKMEPSLGNSCQAHNRYKGLPIGTPKSMDYVGVGNVPTNMVDVPVAGGKMSKKPYMALSLSHELFHCCNVYHHGEEPSPLEDDVIWRKDAQGDIWEGFLKIRVLNTAGKDISGSVTFPISVPPLAMRLVTLHVWRGSSSGDVNCVMRYDGAMACIPKGAPSDRVLLLPSEREFGGGLCTLPDATRSNLNPLLFGPAADNKGLCKENRGACAKQVRVSDLGTAPVR